LSEFSCDKEVDNSCNSFNGEVLRFVPTLTAIEAGKEIALAKKKLRHSWRLSNGLAFKKKM